jgi:virginiamycin B lyase
MRWRYHACFVAVLVLGAAVSGCSIESGSESPREDPVSLQLPHGAWPSDLAFSRDGSLWITGSAEEAVGRLGPNGKLQQYQLPGSENSPSDIVEGPEGAMWIMGFEEFIRIDPEDDSISIGASFGPYADPEVGLPEVIAPGPDGAVWYVDDGLPVELKRVSPSGSLSSFELPLGETETSVESIALGPDDALWMTLSAEGASEQRDGIGRMTVDGSFDSWPLPQPQSDPAQIVAGPDGALWFTERAGYRIGRITTHGELSEFQLRSGLAPVGIAAGPDEALWFATAKRVGRVTTEGEIETWPVPGANNLYNIAVGEDGDLWITDGEAGVVHHLDPPL